MKKILIVDDSLIMRQSIKNKLEELGHTVIGEASTGAEAIKLYDEVEPDIVTMDITMPHIDGIQATQILKNNFPNAKIIMITSHGQENLVRQAIKAGAKSYILKPVTRNKLEQIILKLSKK